MLDPKQLEWTRRFVGFSVDAGADLASPGDVDPPAGDAGSESGDDPPVRDAVSAGQDDLPKPMLSDCQIVHGVVPAPDNFVLCAMHGHILDTDTKQIVANNLKEFEAGHPEFGKLPKPLAPDCKPEPGKINGPAHHMLCGTHGHVLDIKAKQVIAWSIKDYAKRYPPKKAAPAADASKAATPPFDKAHAQESLRNILGGVTILLDEFWKRKADVLTDLERIDSTLCTGPAADVREALASAEASMHAQNEAAGEYIAEFPKTPPAKIPKVCHDTRDALGQFSQAMVKLQACLDHPPKPPSPPSPPWPPENPALEAQRELLRRRDMLLGRQKLLSLQPLQALGEKIQPELDTAYDVARAILAG